MQRNQRPSFSQLLQGLSSEGGAILKFPLTLPQVLCDLNYITKSEPKERILSWKGHTSIRPPVTSLLFHCFAFCFHLVVLFYWDKVCIYPRLAWTMYMTLHFWSNLMYGLQAYTSNPSLCSARDQIQGFMYFREKCSYSSHVFLEGLSPWISFLHSEPWLFFSSRTVECSSNCLLILERPLQFDQAPVSRSEPWLWRLLMSPWGSHFTPLYLGSLICSIELSNSISPLTVAIKRFT